MFYSLNGTLTHMDAAFVVIECGGVGFKCSTTANTMRRLPKLGERTKLFTYLNVREDALDLYGFSDEKELNCFKMLLSVSGVGPRVALSILSEITPEKFAFCAAAGDAKTLTHAPGVGMKLAQRIVLELKDKISSADAATGFSEPELGVISASGNAGEAVNALMVLGYAKSEASAAVAKCDSALPIEEIIRQSLKLLVR